MTSVLAEQPDGPVGSQRPRIQWVPDYHWSAGVEAVELAASAGLILDPWQQWLLRVGLSEDDKGKWQAFEVAEMVSRQNGKGGVLEAVALAGLYLFGDTFIGWSAHEFKTCREGFLRVQALIDNTDDLRRRVKKVTTSHGEEGIELVTKQRLRFMARSTGAGRGFTGDRLVLDEAQHLGDTALEAILPTMSARPNPQVWYAATAPDPAIAPCDVLARLRKRALKRSDPGLVYAEWSIDPHTDHCGEACRVHDDPGAVASWVKANPALGIRISVDHVRREHQAMSAEGFARERLGVGRWPSDEAGWAVIDETTWQALADPPDRTIGYPGSSPLDPVAFAADITPDRSWGAIAVAGRRADGLRHVEVVDHRAGTSWMVPRLLELNAKWRPCGVIIDAAGPAGSLIAPLKEAGFESIAPAAKPPDGGMALITPTAQQSAQACGALYDAATDAKDVRHLGQAALASALAGAKQRPLGDSWAWARKGTSVDISPLVAVTLALWLHATRGHMHGPDYDTLESIW